MCKTLQVSPSGYYGWVQRAPSARAVANVVLTERIREAFVASDETYGMPRIRIELNEAGIVASRKRIAHLMRQGHMRGVSRRRGYVVTTERDKRQRPAPDLVNRQFVATGLNQLWVADMTYIPTWAGFLYLAVVLDVFSRKVVGWAFGENMTSDLVLAALNMALLTRKPESVIHHSDQGSQYTSIAFGNRCKAMGVRPSMGTATQWLRVSLPAWNANLLPGASGETRPKPDWRSSRGSRVGTTRADAIRVSAICHL